VLLDARNDYESTIGKFRGAITPAITVFREFTAVADNLAHLKDKQIVTYCTGGIRCEKASAVLKERGFTNVRQLHGGIIRYGEETGGAHWEGKCFVFDTRRAIPIAPNNTSIIAQCAHCGVASDEQRNCAVLSCDKWFVACEACLDECNGACSPVCAQELHKRTPEKQLNSVTIDS